MSSDEDLEEFDQSVSDEDSFDEEPVRKKTRSEAQYFFDNEVEEDDEEEEDDEPAEPGYRYTQPLDVQRNRGMRITDYTDEQLRATAARYDDQYSDGEDGDMMVPSSSSRSLSQNLPTLSDRIWMVKCKPGSERQAVISLLERCFAREAAEQPLDIKSAICCDNLVGYIHIEAKTQAAVKQAITGLRLYHQGQSGITLLPNKEMPDLLKVPRQTVSLEKGNWVRFKRGLYKGDLGQVYRVTENKIWVKLIPRLDVGVQATISITETGKRRRQQRFPAKFFSVEAVRNAGGDEHLRENFLDSQTGEYFDMYKNDRFKNGFLYKATSIKSLDTTNIQPELSEIKKFQERLSEDDSDSLSETQSALLKTRRKPHQSQFAKGDTVEVTEGGLKHLTGVVEVVQDHSVWMMPNLDDFQNLLKFEASQLRKYFKEGDHVEVLGGRYKNETGLVVKVDGDVVVVFSDLTNQEFQVLIQDIQGCSNVTTGKVQLGDYELHDLVSLGQQAVGVVVKVERDSFLILDTTGNLKTVRLQEMGPKRRSGVSYDRQQVQIASGDMVKILDGKYKGKQGTVKYVCRNHVFVHSRDVTENSGVFVVRAACCAVLGSTKVATGRFLPPQGMGSRGGRGGSFPPSSPYIDDRNGSSYGGGGGDRGRSSGGGGRGGAGGGRGGRFNRFSDPLMNAAVKIKTGPWKGYLGTVKDCTESHYRVELTSKSRVVAIPRDDIIAANEVGPRATMDHHMHGGDHMMDDQYDNRYPYQTPMRGDRTPMRGDRTPMRGDRTPMRGDRTPMRGDQTPIHESGSPLHEGFAHPNTPGHWDSRDWDTDLDRNVVTPNYSTPYSPYGSIGTPQDLHPSTPGAFSFDTYQPYSPYTPTTPKPYPQTPNTPPNPQTPGLTDSYDSHDTSGESGLTDMIEVRIHGDYSGGQYKNETGILREVGNYCEVELYSGPRISVPPSFLEPVPPLKKDKIKIIYGEAQNAIGSLIGIDGNDGIVKIDGQGISIFEMGKIGKYVGE